MKKIMILGASILQLPAILKAKEMGLEVIAVDMDKNAIGFEHADICLEISTIDIPGVVEAAKKYKVNAVMTLASDMPMRTVAAVAKELNIVGISEETAINATNKARMRQCLKENNVPIPMFHKVSNRQEFDAAIAEYRRYGMKFIVKPADNSGSRGVFLVNKLNDSQLVEKAYNHSKEFSKSGDIIVEEYMEGPEVSVETLSVDGECNVIQITDKLTTGAPYFVEMGHNEPSMLPEETRSRISEVAKAAIKAIGIENGPSHTEIKITKEGPKIVELGARLGGDNITTHLVPLSTGVNMVENCIKIALGEKPDLENKWDKGAAIRYLKPAVGKIMSIEGVESAEKIDGVKQISIVHPVGDFSKEIQSSTDRVGFVIAQMETPEIAIVTCEMAVKKINVRVEEA